MTPLQKIEVPFPIHLYIKRDDLIHPFVTGNKWRKLKYNLQSILDQRKKGIITFGGAFSNHIYATAAAAHEKGIGSVGIIRGEYDANNPTIQYAQSQGMKLHFVSRSAYKEKEDSEEILTIINQYPSYSVIPEGGANTLAIKGVSDIQLELSKQINNPYSIITAVGTGATLVGLSQDKAVEVIGIPVLKSQRIIEDLAVNLNLQIEDSNIRLFHNFHRGGYARHDDTLIKFINDFHETYSIPLDPIYTGKAMMGLYHLCENGYFAKDSHVVFLHTGGLQGNVGFKYRFPGKLSF